MLYCILRMYNAAMMNRSNGGRGRCWRWSAGAPAEQASHRASEEDGGAAPVPPEPARQRGQGAGPAHRSRSRFAGGNVRTVSVLRLYCAYYFEVLFTCTLAY